MSTLTRSESDRLIRAARDEARAQGFAIGREEARARAKAISHLPGADGWFNLTNTLIAHWDVSVDQARATLQAAASDKPSAEILAAMAESEMAVRQ